jgi:hypothetical protein
MVKYMVELIKKFESITSKKGHMWEHFEDEINDLLPELKKNLRTRIQGHTTETVWSNLPYGMNIRTCWSSLKIDL